ncbi:MAG: protein kinase [Victivallales bacterium]|nr:protein kinase [Victivallales bacterium]
MPGPGDIIAGCRIITECGHGAFGRVYLAEDCLGRRVAVKLLLTPEAGEYELQGLRNFIRIGTGVPGLMPILHCGLEQGLPFYVMEAADNSAAIGYEPDTLAHRLRKYGRLPASECLDICHALLDGLEAMHRAGFVHRDIKPENVLFVNGSPKLADPGLTRTFDQTLSVAGTPGYIAPEIYRGHAKASPTSDIYALGILIYHTVTGRPPERFPKLPEDLPVEELYQICRPIVRFCAESPQARLQNCAACRKVMPRTIQPHGPLLRFRDALFVRPALRRRLAVGLLIVLLLGAAFAAGGWWMHRRAALRRQALSARTDALRQELNWLQDRLPQLNLQLNGLGEQPVALPVSQWEPLLAAGKPDQPAAQLAAIREGVQACALRHLPAPGSTADFSACASGWGYLSSPLGNYFLPATARENLREQLVRDAARLAGSNGVELGSAVVFSSQSSFRFTFVAPGSFVSPTTKNVRRIPYPYWICESELSAEQFQLISWLTARRVSPRQAAEYLCWNEVLSFCRNMTKYARGRSVLPQGYAFRPPTEEEWEFAAFGGWEGRPPPARDLPSDQENRPPGDTPHSVLGLQLQGMDDNLSELVEPYPELPPEQPCSVVARGASYRDKRSSVVARHAYLRSQCYVNGSGGFRPVLAPTAEDYFTKSWYRGPDIREVTIQSAVYAGWSICHARTNWSRSSTLAADVGAALPETVNRAELGNWMRQASLIPSFPCPLGIQRVDGAWRRLSDKASVSIPVKSQGENLDCLGASASAFCPVGKNTGLPSTLLRWENQAAFESRLDAWLRNGTLATIELDGRRLLVLRAGLASDVARPFARFMGARQPVLATSEQVRRAAELLPHDLRIALGPVYFYGDWEQSDGSVSEFPGLEIDDTEKRLVPISPVPHVILAAHRGRLVMLDYLDAILVEAP